MLHLGGRERRLAGVELDEDFLGVGQRTAVTPDDHPLGGRLADARVIFQLAALCDARRAVDDEREVLVGGHTDGQRVGSEHVLHAEGRRDGRTRVGTRDADHVRLRRHRCVITRDAVVAGVARGDHAHAVFLCLLNGH